jgi:hypothetical protein
MVDIPENGHVINPTWHVDKINIVQKNIVPEIITVTVNNTQLTASGKTKFDLTYKSISGGLTTLYTCNFDLGDSADTFSSKLDKSNLTILTDYNSKVTLQTVTDSSSTITSYVYTIKILYYRSPSPVPTSAIAGVRVLKTQSHSAPITGTFSLKIGQDLLSIYDANKKAFVSDLAYNVGVGALSEAFNLYYNTTEISVAWQQRVSASDNISLLI